MKKITQIIFLLILGTSLYSQIPPDLPQFPGDRGMSRHERFQNMYIWKLTEYLDLSEEQSYKFFPRLRKYREEEAVKKQKLRDAYMKGMEILNSEKEVDRKDFERVLNQVEELEKEILEMRIDFIRAQGDVLTPEQQLKFLVFNERFRQQMRKMLKNDKD